MDLARVLLAFAVLFAMASGSLLLARALLRRFSRSAPSAEDGLDEIRARLEGLEARDAQLEEVQERLDFLERVIPAIREGKPLPAPPAQRARTPV